MRLLISTTLILAATALPAAAQPAGIKPKPVATVAVPPATQTPLDTIKALSQGERQAIQSDLAWVGKYNGLINGEASDRLVTAIKAYQTGRKSQPTGVLNPQEREQLAASAKKLQANVGWKLIGDPGTGMRTGLPSKLAPQQTSDANGTHWRAASGSVEISLTRRKQADITTAKLATQERAAADRKVTYSTVKPDFFVLSGTQGTGQGAKNFYMRGQLRGDEVRLLTIHYDEASKAAMEPVVIAMSSAFNPFPTGAQAVGPPPRKSVEYASGVIVSGKGFIVTDRQPIEGCQSIVIAGHGNADKVAEDKSHDLALLRIYGARDLAALALGNAAAKSEVTLTGITDPRSQGGGAAVSSARASVTPTGTNGALSLTPVPGLGFAGAAALDAGGQFAGIAQLRPIQLAGPVAGTAAPQAMLVPADIVRGFLKSNDVAMDGTAKDVKAAMVRVICVRK
ncbi:MAG: peptidoglycan-binding protein [Rhizobiales bacterium]|nr:peptidoglycan-binding protein [Hyphomicrobiales bacterium]